MRLASQAADHGARLVLFPELSLVGYGRGLTTADALVTSDARLQPLRNLARARAVTVVAGAPLAAHAGLNIASVVFAPDGTVGTYVKQHVPDAEAATFVPGRGGPPLAVGDEVVGLAICADISQPALARAAVKQGATVYAASCLISEHGYEADAAFLRRAAVDHQILVLDGQLRRAGWRLAVGGEERDLVGDGRAVGVGPRRGRGARRGGAQPRALDRQGRGVRSVTLTTACPRNCYSTCALRVEVEDGRIRRIDTHPAARATPGGPCLKGLSYVERVYSPDRILHPLRRTRGGAFARVSWDSALDEIARRLTAVRRDHGPQSVLYYCASGTKGLMNRVSERFWRLYGGYTGTYGDLCWPSGLEATRLTLGENKHSAPWDLARARLIVLWGKNPAETNIHQQAFVDQALDAGGTLIVVDPRRTQSAERASLLIQPRPGTDGALALAVAHLLIRNGGVDRAFVDRHVVGFGAFAASAAGFTPERAADITDVPPAAIHRLAEAFAAIRPATISAGFGLQRFANSGQTMRAILALVAITGNVGRPGAGWVYANLQSHVFDAVRDPVASFPPEVPDGVARVAVSMARLGPDMLALADPPLAAAWVERGNPIPQNPGTPAVVAAFRALGFRVVVDQFLTDTAREADIVLPAKTMFEQSDVIGAYWHAYLQLKQKVIEPPGEVKPESEIYRLLARRLGMPEAEDGTVFPVSDAEVDAYLERALAPFPEVTLARLREGPVPAPGAQDVAFEDLVFRTPSGKIELESREAVARWGVAAVADYTEPLESVRRPDPDPAKYPLYLLTPNTKNRIHSQFGNLRMIRQFDDRPRVAIHPDDARARGVRDGARVRVFNARGAIEVEALLDNGLKAGCVAVTNGWWLTDGAAVNVLSAARETDMGHGAAFHENRVQVEVIATEIATE